MLLWTGLVRDYHPVGARMQPAHGVDERTLRRRDGLRRRVAVERRLLLRRQRRRQPRQLAAALPARPPARIGGPSVLNSHNLLPVEAASRKADLSRAPGPAIPTVPSPTSSHQGNSTRSCPETIARALRAPADCQLLADVLRRPQGPNRGGSRAIEAVAEDRPRRLAPHGLASRPSAGSDHGQPELVLLGLKMPRPCIQRR